MRISLRYLFGIIAFCSVVAWCAARVGFDNGTFWFAAGASAFLSTLFVYLAADEKRRSFAPLAPIPVVLCCLLPFVSLSLLANAFLLLVTGLFCAYRPPLRVGTLCAIVMISAALGFMAGVVPGAWEVKKLVDLRQEFPIESMENRLKYEQRSREALSAVPVVLDAEVASRLSAWESDLDMDNHRRLQLERIHDHQYELFVRATGFGVGRMLRPRPEALRRPPLRNISFDATSFVQAESKHRPWEAFASTGKSNDVAHLHTVSRNDFLDAESFGAVIAPVEKVIGFIEHGFHYPPVDGLKQREKWSILRLELISLLKFDEPRVYVLDHLPRMDELASADVPTRPLDKFEANALGQLRTKEDLVIAQEGNKYRMLGSLRAANQCLNCHSVSRGALLGAFSYKLLRDDIVLSSS